MVAALVEGLRRRRRRC